MQLARITGTVVASCKDKNLTGLKLLLLQLLLPLTPDRLPSGNCLVSVDSVGAGEGEEVFFVRGVEASFPFLPAKVPTDANVVGIVDHWSIKDIGFKKVQKQKV